MVVMADDHPLAACDSITPEDFFAQELVLFKEGYFHREVINRLLLETGLQPHIGFETNLIPLIKQIVKQGFGISTLLQMVIRDEPALVARPFSRPVLLDLSLAWRKGGYLSRANQTFIEFLAKEVRTVERIIIS